MSLQLIGLEFLTSSSQVDIRSLNTQYMMRLNRSMSTNSMLGPNMPIEYPIGMVSAPQPIDAHIMKLAVLELVTLNLNSPGRVINSANIDAKNIPTSTTPPYAAQYFISLIAAININSDVPIIPTSSTFRRSDIFPFTQRRMILKAVFEIQNSEPRMLAPSGVAIFQTTAQVGIQLPKPTYQPMQNRYSTQVRISAFRLIGYDIQLFRTESLDQGALRKQNRGMDDRNSRPMTKKLCYWNLIIINGPTNPPAPNIKCSNCTQQS